MCSGGSLQPLEEIFLSGAPGVLSLTGGGGKTSLMFHLARHLARSGKRVLTTTTTKILLPTAEQSNTVIMNRDPAMIVRQIASARHPAGHVTAVAMPLADAGKVGGFPPEAIGVFEASGLFDWIIVEADGSAQRPLKAPADHEPVISPNTTVLVAVAGLEVLGRPLTEELVFRPERAGKLMELAAGETITESALAMLLAHPLGSFKGAPPGARRFIFLNKADDEARRQGGARIAGLLRQRIPIAEAVLVGQALEDIRVHAVHPLRLLP